MIEARPTGDATMLPIADRSQQLVLMPPPTEANSIQDVLSVGHYIWLISRSKWKILSFVTTCVSLATLYCVCVKPMYEATARITIDPRVSSLAIGQEAVPPGGSDNDQVMNTEMQIIQSDAVLRPVAQQFNLLHTTPAASTISAQPALPNGLTGALKWAKRLKAREASQEELIDAPVVLPGLSVNHPPNSLLLDISYRSINPRHAALVANAVAQSYIVRGMETRARSSTNLSSFMEKQIAELKNNMDASSLALARWEQKLGVINPDEKTSMVAAHLLQLQTEYTEAQNDRILKQTQYSALTLASPGSNSAAALEVSPQAALLSRQEDQVRAAEQRLALAKTVYGPNYPEYKRAANDLAEVKSQYEQMRLQIGRRIQISYQEALNREQMLHQSLIAAKDESDRLNTNSAQYYELKREAEANKNLYNELFRKIKEAGVNAGFQGSSIRIANEARPAVWPVFPQKGLIIGITFVLSLLGSVMVAIVADMLDNTLRDPEQARRFTGCHVLATLPSVPHFLEAWPPLALEERAGDFTVASRPTTKKFKRHHSFETDEFYRDAISILLSTVMSSRDFARPRTLLITSAGAGDGKSSCAAHLALESASLGKRTLLIDADLRNPFQHRFFKLSNKGGLGGPALLKPILEHMRQPVEGFEAFDVVVAGERTSYGISQVGRRVAHLIQQSLQGYDFVIVDGPPMIGLSEPVEIACATDGVLIIGHAARTSRQAISRLVCMLNRIDANVLGVVLNHVQSDMSESYAQYSEYNAYTARQLG